MTAIATNEMDAVDQQLLNEMQDRFPLIREPLPRSPSASA